MRKIALLVLLVGAMVVVSGLTSCATHSAIGGTSDPHGLISQGKAAGADAQELDSYMVILGLFDAGYKDYAKAVKDAEASGKKVSSVTRWYLILNKTTAYAK